MLRVFTAQYGLSPYMKPMLFVFKWSNLNFPKLDRERQIV